MNDDQIETLLRKAPGLTPPPGLLASLRADITIPRPAARVAGPSDSSPWLRRWLPALGLTGCLLACAVVFAVQTGTLTQLRTENESLLQAGRKQEEPGATGDRRRVSEERELEWLRKDQQELLRLREEVGRLRGQVQEITRLRTENQQLRTAAAGVSRAQSEQEFFDRVPDARSKSERIRCINNMKQIGLAARIWATEHGDVLPSDFVTMMNELSTPKILHCPADTSRPEAADWSTYGAANNSYEMLSPGVEEANPEVVYVRCPIHNNVNLVDGSVQQLSPQRQVVAKDGRYYIGGEAALPADEVRRRRYGLPPGASLPGGPAATNAGDEVLRQRYGLPPPQNP